MQNNVMKDYYKGIKICHKKKVIFKNVFKEFKSNKN